MDDGIGLDAFRSAAERGGLALTLAEAQEALAGANRWRHQVEQLRRQLQRNFEPASVFRAPRDEG
jgi:hypothetical protein